MRQQSAFGEKSTAQSLERIRYAVLKLSHGDLAELRKAVETPQIDWRDVLVAAGPVGRLVDDFCAVGRQDRCASGRSKDLRYVYQAARFQ